MKVHVGLREERLEGHRLARRIALLFPCPLAPAVAACDSGVSDRSAAPALPCAPSVSPPGTPQPL